MRLRFGQQLNEISNAVCFISEIEFLTHKSIVPSASEEFGSDTRLVAVKGVFVAGEVGSIPA